MKKLVYPFEGFVKPLVKEKEEGSVCNNDSSFSSSLSSDSGTVDSREGSDQGSPLFGPQSADSSEIILAPLVVPPQTSEQKSANSPAELFGRLSMSTKGSLKKISGGNKRNRKTKKKYTKKTKNTQKKVNKKRHTAHRKTHKKKYVKSKHHKTYKY